MSPIRPPLFHLVPIGTGSNSDSGLKGPLFSSGVPLSLSLEIKLAIVDRPESSLVCYFEPPTSGLCTNASWGDFSRFFQSLSRELSHQLKPLIGLAAASTSQSVTVESVLIRVKRERRNRHEVPSTCAQFVGAITLSNGREELACAVLNTCRRC